MIYFDNASTTRVIPEAVNASSEMMSDFFGNPSSLHSLGFEAEKRVTEVRGDIARILGASADEIFFTSCGTESNNLSVFGAAERSGRKKHIVTTAFEHPSVLNAVKKLESKGYNVTYVPPRSDGSVYAVDIAEAVCDDTFLVSVMAVNNELGSVMDIAGISRAVRTKNKDILIHTDAVQAFMKIPLNVKKLDVDLLSLSGHKIHAPKGIGALYAKRGTGIAPQVVGGGQEKGMRSGTEATSQIAALGAAVNAAESEFKTAAERMYALSSELEHGLSALDGVRVILPKSRAPHILTAIFPKFPSEVIMRILESEGIYVSAGSACSKGKKSHVLSVLGVPDREIKSAVRISLSRFSTSEDVSAFLKTAEEKLV